MKTESDVLKKKDKVLVVEDEDTLRELLKSILEEGGLNVLTARDGVDAVEQFIAHKDEIGVVLSDLGLPRLGGWDAFLKMREINPKLKGILASGYFNQKVRNDILKSGARMFIQKPYNPPEIISVIRRMLAEKE
jgi:two-component system, cell cycle sensor histidine kinase and response regulator CckA